MPDRTTRGAQAVRARISFDGESHTSAAALRARWAGPIGHDWLTWGSSTVAHLINWIGRPSIPNVDERPATSWTSSRTIIAPARSPDLCSAADLTGPLERCDVCRLRQACYDDADRPASPVPALLSPARGGRGGCVSVRWPRRITRPVSAHARVSPRCVTAPTLHRNRRSLACRA